LQKGIFSFLIILFPLLAQAEWRLGANIGFGGTGISSTVQINGVDLEVHRSDGPLAYSLSVEYPMSVDTTLAVDMTKGVSLSPFSEGVTFTGATYRWYYPNVYPAMVKSKTNSSTLLLQEWCPYIGPSMGLAQGTINRQKDLVSSVDGSGIYIGMHAGVDYQLSPNFVSRSELASGMTLGSSGLVKTSLSEFVIQTGIYFILD